MNDHFSSDGSRGRGRAGGPGKPGGGGKSGGSGKRPGGPRRPQDGRRPSGPGGARRAPLVQTKSGADERWVYGLHAVAAALANPRRVKKRLFLTKNAADKLAWSGAPKAEIVGPDQIDHVVKGDAAHQGAALLAEDVPPVPLGAFLQNVSGRAPILMLDQVTDPQNVGAAFRVALAFGARAVVMQDRKSPPLTGALAKAAAGAADILPHVREVNLARALEALRAAGYHTAGLDGAAEDTVDSMPTDRPICLVVGSEGAGLRQLVAETCIQRVRIPIDPRMESLNVSTAASIALYEATRGGRGPVSHAGG